MMEAKLAHKKTFFTFQMSVKLRVSVQLWKYACSALQQFLLGERNFFLTLIAATSEQSFDGNVCLRAFHIWLLFHLFSSIKL